MVSAPVVQTGSLNIIKYFSNMLSTYPIFSVQKISASGPPWTTKSWFRRGRGRRGRHDLRQVGHRSHRVAPQRRLELAVYRQPAIGDHI